MIVPRDEILRNEITFCAIADTAEQIMNSTAHWDVKFSVIFSNTISGAVQGTGITFDYCDPDGSYEDDVRAYVNALTAKAAELKKIIAAVCR